MGEVVARQAGKKDIVLRLGCWRAAAGNLLMPASNPAASLPCQAFLDRLRVMLTGLVILHHTAIMHGADGDGSCASPPTTRGQGCCSR